MLAGSVPGRAGHNRRVMSLHHDHSHGHHHHHELPEGLVPPGYRRVLWIALAVNLTMFFAEVVASASSDSVSLLADAIDFFGDAANYGLSLAVLSMAAQVRSKAAIAKAACMAAFGVFVLARAAWAWQTGTPPQDA